MLRLQTVLCYVFRLYCVTSSDCTVLRLQTVLCYVLILYCVMSSDCTVLCLQTVLCYSFRHYCVTSSDSTVIVFRLYCVLSSDRTAQCPPFRNNPLLPYIVTQLVLQRPGLLSQVPPQSIVLLAVRQQVFGGRVCSACTHLNLSSSS